MKLRYRVGTRIIYWIWKILFGFRVEGRDNIPNNGGIIIAANHLSNYDPPLIGTGVWNRECYFFAKQELFAINRFYTWVIKVFNAYPVDTKKTSKAALELTMKLLNKGLGIIFFPEGTRSKTGNFLQFNAGVGWLALKCGVPIIPTLINGTNTPLIRQFIRKTGVCVRFGEPILPHKFKSEKDGRKLIAREVEKSIKSLPHNR